MPPLPAPAASLLALVASFLADFPELAPAVEVLEELVRSHGLIGSVGTWQGGSRPASLRSSLAMGPENRDLLLCALEILASHSTSLPSFLNSTLIAQREANLASGACASLVQAREDLRRLETELKSATSSRRHEPLEAQADAIRARLPALIKQARGLDSLRRSRQLNVVDSIDSHYAPSHSLYNMGISKLQVIKKIHGHRRDVFCVAVQDSWIVTGADDGLVKLWNANTGNLHATFRGHTAEITDLALTSALVCSCSEDKTVRVWELRTGRPVAVMNHHKEGVQRVSFVDENTLVSSGDDGACCVWDIGAAVSHLQAVDQALLEWDRVEEMRRTQNLPPLPAPTLHPFLVTPPVVFPHVFEGKQHQMAKVFCQAVHPNGNLVATGGQDSVVRVWSIKPIEPEPGYPRLTAATKPHLVSGSYVDGAEHLVMRLSDDLSNGVVQRVEWSKRGDRLLSYTNRDPSVRVWTWPAGPTEARFRVKPRCLLLTALPAMEVKGGRRPPVYVHSAAWTCDDARIITSQSILPKMYINEPEGFWDQRICVWDSRAGDLIWSLRAHRRQAALIRPHPTLSHIVATGGEDGLIIFWDVDAGKLVRQLDVVGTVGYPDVIDGQWTENCASVDFCATDSLGRLILISTGDGAPQRASYVEQFLDSETAPLNFDMYGYARDANTATELHLLPRAQLVDVEGAAYGVQPPPVAQGQGAFSEVPNPLSPEQIRVNRAQRLSQVALREKVLASLEDGARQAEQAKFAAMDADIASAKNADEAQALSSSLARPKKVTVASRVGADAGGDAAAAANRRKAAAASRAQQVIEISDDDEDDDDDEPLKEDGRARRKAAKKANKRIIRTAQSDADDDDEEEEEEDESRSARRDDLYKASSSRAREDDDEDEEGLSLSSTTSSSDRENLGASDDDDGFSGDDARNRRTSSRRRSAGQPGSYASSEPEVLLRNSVVIDSSWLRMEKSSLGMYVPQIRDQVIYVVHGHQSFLAQFPSPVTGQPWTQWDFKEWPTVKCTVEQVEYVFPEEEELAKVSDSCPAVCRCRLRITHVPIENGEFVANPLGLEFFVAYRCSELADFLVPADKYDRGMREKWAEGDQVWAMFGNRQANEMELYQGTVKEVRSDWCKNPWEAVKVDWGGDTDPSNVSPWELRRNNAVDAEPYAVLPEEQQSALATALEESDACRVLLEAPERDLRPVFTPLSLLVARLRQGTFYRCWDEVQADIWRVAHCFHAHIGGAMSRAAIQARSFETAALWALGKARGYVQGSHDRDDDAQVAVSYAGLSRTLGHALEQMRQLDSNHFFAAPPHGLPGYDLLISRPMDLWTVGNKLQRRYYETSNRPPPVISLAEAKEVTRRFVADVELICDNATFYNEPNSVANAVALQLKSFAKMVHVDYDAIKCDAVALGQDLKAPPAKKARATQANQAREREDLLSRRRGASAPASATRAGRSKYVFSSESDDLDQDSDSPSDAGFNEDDDNQDGRGRRRSSRARAFAAPKLQAAEASPVRQSTRVTRASAHVASKGGRKSDRDDTDDRGTRATRRRASAAASAENSPSQPEPRPKGRVGRPRRIIEEHSDNEAVVCLPPRDGGEPATRKSNAGSEAVPDRNAAVPEKRDSQRRPGSKSAKAAESLSLPTRSLRGTRLRPTRYVDPSESEFEDESEEDDKPLALRAKMTRAERARRREEAHNEHPPLSQQQSRANVADLGAGQGIQDGKDKPSRSSVKSGSPSPSPQPSRPRRSAAARKSKYRDGSSSDGEGQGRESSDDDDGVERAPKRRKR